MAAPGQKYAGIVGVGHNRPIVDEGTLCRRESCAPAIAAGVHGAKRGILLAYNADGHQYLSTQAVKAILDLLPPKLSWMRHFLEDIATPTVYRDMTDVWTGAHWSDTPNAQRHHFMRTSEQSVDEAYEAAVKWIAENGRKASFNLRRIWKEQLGYYDPLFVEEPLGDAFHALQDSYSEGHVKREKVGRDFIITDIHVYDKTNKETHSELDKEWDSALGKEAIIACRELVHIIIVSALEKTDEGFEERWRSLFATLQEMFLPTKVAG